jgi:predicted amidophosphoribosyltransferase
MKFCDIFWKLKGGFMSGTTFVTCNRCKNKFATPSNGLCPLCGNKVGKSEAVPVEHSQQPKQQAFTTSILDEFDTPSKQLPIRDEALKIVPPSAEKPDCSQCKEWRDYSDTCKACGKKFF